MRHFEEAGIFSLSDPVHDRPHRFSITLYQAGPGKIQEAERHFHQHRRRPDVRAVESIGSAERTVTKVHLADGYLDAVLFHQRRRVALTRLVGATLP